MNKHIRTKVTRGCKQRVGVRMEDTPFGAKSARLTWCCRIRGKSALFVAGMRCIGRTHPECPLMKLEVAREKEGVSE